MLTGLESPLIGACLDTPLPLSCGQRVQSFVIIPLCKGLSA